ncbi:MAG: DUF1294 domain-containing protein [Chloroflexota bacterium]|nr:DUF1294 domain-containing protein [Chloroflexota bacterium]
MTLYILLGWLVAINLLTCIVYRVDKSAAQAGKPRVPEATLLLLEAVGGTVGAWFAMWIMRPRHKTQSGGFLFWFFAILMIQITGVGVFFLLR